MMRICALHLPVNVFIKISKNYAVSTQKLLFNLYLIIIVVHFYCMYVCMYIDIQIFLYSQNSIFTNCSSIKYLTCIVQILRLLSSLNYLLSTFSFRMNPAIFFTFVKVSKTVNIKSKYTKLLLVIFKYRNSNSIYDCTYIMKPKCKSSRLKMTS